MRLGIKQIIEAVKGECLTPELASIEIEAITTDSRAETSQGLFVPLKGERFDGHQFIQGVYDKGIRATLTMNKEVIDPRLCTIFVPDTGQALLDLAHYYRVQYTLPVIGITGSVGKTSTKEIVAAVLSGKWQVHKTEGNFNNEIGLPLTLFKLAQYHEAAVIEMGMNHFGEIHRLSLSAAPQVAIITNVGTAHIENLGSREGILKAKLEILDGLDQNGILVVNGDNDLLGSLSAVPCKMITYGLSETNDYWANNISSTGHYTSATIHTPTKTFDVRIEALGEHMIYNTVAAIAVAEYLGLTTTEILKGLENYIPAKMRMHITTRENDVIIIDDTYNASPDSMKAALTVLSNYDSKGRKIAVLGDMFEMGEFAPALHEEVGDFAAGIGIDEVIAIGTLAKHIYEGCVKKGTMSAVYYPDKQSFVKEIKTHLKAGDTVLFKASRGMKFEDLLDEVGKVKRDE